MKRLGIAFKTLALLSLLFLTACGGNAPIAPANTPTASAVPQMNILKRRYARGEIPAEQFEAMKRQLAES